MEMEEGVEKVRVGMQQNEFYFSKVLFDNLGENVVAQIIQKK